MMLREEEVFVTSGEKKGSVRKEINVVSGMRAAIVQSRHRKPPPPSEPHSSKHEAEASREKETSEAEAILM